jgi:hypothetical protein
VTRWALDGAASEEKASEAKHDTSEPNKHSGRRVRRTQEAQEATQHKAHKCEARLNTLTGAVNYARRKH